MDLERAIYFGAAAVAALTLAFAFILAMRDASRK
jgi:hypothetical protein